MSSLLYEEVSKFLAESKLPLRKVDVATHFNIPVHQMYTSLEAEGVSWTELLNSERLKRYRALPNEPRSVLAESLGFTTQYGLQALSNWKTRMKRQRRLGADE